MMVKKRAAGTENWGMAWVCTCAAFGVHVIDEALFGFLEFWNPLVHSLRERLPLLPLPTFRFGVWLGGLVVAVGLLFLLSPFAFGAARWMRPLSYLYAVVMCLNGLLHVSASWSLGEAVPGVYSSPILVLAGVFMLVRLRRSQWEPEHAAR